MLLLVVYNKLWIMVSGIDLSIDKSHTYSNTSIATQTVIT